MPRYSAQGLNYQKALKLIEELQKLQIAANITTGGVTIDLDDSQIDCAREICHKYDANFKAGDIHFRHTLIAHPNQTLSMSPTNENANLSPIQEQLNRIEAKVDALQEGQSKIETEVALLSTQLSQDSKYPDETDLEVQALLDAQAQ